MKNGYQILLPCLLVVLAACEQPADYYGLRKLDTHVHLETTDTSFVRQAIDDNFRLLTIAVGSSDFAGIEEQVRFAIHQQKLFPDAVAWATTFSMEHWGTPDWQQDTIDRLAAHFNAGAIAVKVWKDIGMTFRDVDSNFVMIDHPSFDPILDFIAARGKTLVAHIGEPRNCWLPPDSMTVNNDRDYFRRNPQYHMYLHPDYPTYEQQIAARDRMLEKHPDLKVIGAHLGSLEWSVDELAGRLDRFPNLAVDMAARICHFQVQNRDKVRDFFHKYQDRLIYATDLGAEEEEDAQVVMNHAHKTWMEDWRYFSTSDQMSSSKVNAPFNGLALEETILRKIYHDNGARWLSLRFPPGS
jgi:predicted TIM-barrel fold metal-dependent hydrolase